MRRWLSSESTLISVLFEGTTRIAQFRAALTAPSELALILLAVLYVARAPSLVRQFRVPALLCTAAWGICLALIYWQMLFLMPLPPPFSTETNNYPRLIEICQQMGAIEKTGFPKSREPERQALIVEAIPLAEAANFVAYRLPDDAALNTWRFYIAPAQYVRNMARTIDAECGTALSGGDIDRACNLAITNVRLGVMLQRGGTIVEDLVGIAVQSIANRRLAELRSRLSPDQARRVIAAWDRALAQQEPIESIVYRDRAMAERGYGWAARLGNILEHVGIPSNIYYPFREAHFRRETTAQLLHTELAIRLYQSEHGNLPASLDDLVSNYLSKLPIDIYSQQPLVYRTTADGFVLYSVGHDRVDNGGKFTNTVTYYSRDFFGNFVNGYDYDLDTITRP